MKGATLILIVLALCCVSVMAAKPQASGIECDLCTIIVGYVEDYALSNKTVDNVENFLNKTVCTLLPSIIVPECQALVDEYAPVLAKHIVASESPSDVCTHVGLCASSMFAKAKMNHKNKLPTQTLKAVHPKQSASGIGCTLCTLIVGFVEDKVGSNATLEKIEEFLNTTVCDLLPSFLSAECAALVDEYAVPLAKHIITGEPAAKVCADVHLCSPSKATEFKRVVKQAKAIAYAKEVIVCDLCKLIVGYAEDYLTKNSTIADITKFLNTSVCGKLPSFLSAECAALVDEYAPELAQHIIRGESPVQACTEVHLCAATKKLAEKAAAKKVKPEANAIECAVCRLVVNAAEEELGNSRTDHEVESFLNNTICVRLPGFFKGLCASFVDSYFPELVGKLLTDYNATRVCGEIGVCATSSEQVSYHNFVETVPAKKRN